MLEHQKNPCILLARGVHRLETNSIESQLQRLRMFAARRCLKVVDEVHLSRASVTPWKSEELDALVRRKREVNDFELLLMTDLARFGRGGINHLMTLLRKLTDAGIRVLTLDNGVIDGSLLKFVSSGEEVAANAAQAFVSQ